MSGETNLVKLVQSMKPILNNGEYVFTTVKSIADIPRTDVLCEFREQEGVTLVLERQKADLLNLKYDYIASWITLSVHSALDAVGLTAVFSSELARNGISCNVLAGYYHDHIFVNKNDGTRAVEVLQRLAQNYNG